MSQNWHGHFLEENYKPSRLGNWEVPNWHPKWPDRHCKTTTFQSDDKGHLLAHLKKRNRSREYFKTAWELPKKIDRRLAEELSAPPKYKKRDWEAQKAYHRAACGIVDSSTEKQSLSKRSSVPKPEEKTEVDSKSKSKDSDSKSDTTDLKSELKILESENLESKSGSECSQVEEKINNVACVFHQTCKI